ncbi:hypothetical protein BH09ACT10_BH09ACT10_12650 [soil metagenome]
MPPRLTTNVVARSRLSKRLDLLAPVTFVRAPAGFGKTTLVRQWVEEQAQSGRPTVWLSASPGVDQDAFLADVSQAAEAVTGPTIVVVDAFQNVSGTSVPSQLMDVVRSHAEISLVVTTRTHTLFEDIAHVELDATVLTPRELLFTKDEVADLMVLIGLEGDDRLAERIRREVGGWPAMVFALAAALKDPDLIRAGFEGALESTSDYFREHLLANSLDERQTYIMSRLVLAERLTVDAAEFLLGESPLREELKELERQGYLSSHNERYSGSEMYDVPTMLRREWRRNPTVGDQELSLRLARHYAVSKRPDFAIAQGAAAQDWEFVADMIDRSWQQLLLLHESLVSMILTTMPQTYDHSHPRVKVARHALRAIPIPRHEIPAPLPTNRTDLAVLAQRADIVDIMITSFVTSLVLRQSGYFAEAGALSIALDRLLRIVEDRLPERITEILPMAHVQVAVTHLIGGDFENSIESFKTSKAYVSSPDAHELAPANAGLALVATLKGDVVGARKHHLHPNQMENMGRVKWVLPYVRSAPRLTEALIAIDELREADACEQLVLYAQARRRDEFWQIAAYARARMDLLWGDPEASLARLAAARELHASWDTDDSLAGPLLLAAEVDLLLAQGNGNKAQALLGASHSIHPLVTTARARMAALSGDSGLAMELTRAVLVDDKSWNRTYLDALLIRAECAAARSIEMTGPLWAKAIDLSTRMGLGAGLYASVSEAVLRESVTYEPRLEHILDARLEAGLKDIFSAEVKVVDLTRRERVVLEKLIEELSVPDIARELFVSHNTVKSQLRGLYAKLGAHSRDQAIELARKAGMVG